MAHFILNCRILDGTRREILILQRPRKENEEEILRDLLVTQKRMMGRWRGRRNGYIISGRQDKQS